MFYGSFMYMHDRLADRFPTEVVPGVPAFAAATAAVASPLVRQTDVLTILPGTLPEAELARRLADTDGAIIMKLGRTFPAVRSALAQAGRLEHAMYVERASMAAERWLPVADVDPATVPYFSLIVVPGDSVRVARAVARAATTLHRSRRRRARRADRRRTRARPGRVDHARGHGGPGRGRPRGRLRAVRQPGAPTGRPAAARVRQHRRARPRPARPRPRPGRRAGGCGVGRRRRRVRDGGRRLRGGRGRALLRGRDPGAARRQRRSRRSRPAPARRSARTSPSSASRTG